MSMLASNLLSQQQTIEIKLDELHETINKAERGPMGLTIDSSKTPEWREAKKQYAIYFQQFRKINQQLNKLRKCIGYENVNGRRVPIYKYY